MSLEICLLLLIIILYLFSLIRNYYNGPLTNLTHSMNDKIVVITGGSRGIGFETAKDLLKQGAKVKIGCRNSIQGNKAIDSLTNYSLNNNCTFIRLDLTDYENIKLFTEEIISKFGKIDILINNAGSCFNNFTLSDGIELTYFTNHLGHLILSCLLLNNFNKKGRIINVVTTKYKRISQETFENFISDSNINFAWNRKGYDWMKTYILSKLAGIHLTQYFGNYCSNKNLDIKVVSVHPGFINNHFFREIEKHSFYWFIRDLLQTPFRWCLFKDNIMGAQTILHCCYIAWEKLFNGGYYKDCHYERLTPIGLLNNARNLINFDKNIIQKNNIIKGDKKIMQILD